MRERIARQFWKLIDRDSVLASDILETLLLPSKGVISHTLNISLGMFEKEVRKILNEYILREHKDPLKGINLVLSANAWPEIFRYVFKGNKLVSVIIEIGVDSNNFKSVYAKVENKIRETFAYSIEGIKEAESRYPVFLWEYSKHFCYFQVLNDEIVNISPIMFNYDYFGNDIDTTFIRKSNKRYIVLPTLVIIFSEDQMSRLVTISYLHLDCAKRNNAISLLNMPALADK